MALFSACHCCSSAVPKSFFSTSSSSPAVVATSSYSTSLPLYSPFLYNSLSAIVQSQRPPASIRPDSVHKISCRIDDSSANWGNRPPKETILLPGCDYEHWLIVMEFPKDPKPSPEEMIDTYVKTLATVVGSEEEAKKKIYALSTTTYTGFQANISEETSNKLKGLPGVLWVLPDSYLDVPNKDYGGDKYVDGKVIPRPQPRQSERQQRGYNDRPRNYERRYERRRDGPQVERRNPMPAQRRDPQMGRTDTVQGEGQ